MKRIIACLAVVILLISLFSGCGKTEIIDKEGNTHAAIKEKGGELAQDKYGNLLEEIEDENGKKVTQPFTYPDFIKNSKDEVQNAYFKIKLPNDWTFDESASKFKLQHQGECAKKGEAKCEITIDSAGHGDVEVYYANRLGTEKIIEESISDLITEIKEFETKLFGIQAKAFSCKYSTGSTIYYFTFQYAYAAIGINAIVMDTCQQSGFNIEEFIAQQFTLKDLG